MGAIIIHVDGGGEGVVFQMSLQVDKLQYKNYMPTRRMGRVKNFQNFSI